MAAEVEASEPVLELGANKAPDARVDDRPDQRSRGVEGDEPFVAHRGLPRDRRGDETEARHESAQERKQRPEALDRSLGRANAGRRLERDAAQHADDAPAVGSPHDEQEAVGAEAREHRGDDCGAGVHAVRRDERSDRDEHRRRRQRHAELREQHPYEHRRVPVAEDEFCAGTHAWNVESFRFSRRGTLGEFASNRRQRGQRAAVRSAGQGRSARFPTRRARGSRRPRARRRPGVAP